MHVAVIECSTLGTTDHSHSLARRPHRSCIRFPQVLDDGQEHQHRYSFNASTRVVEEVQAHMERGAAAAGVQLQVVVSGDGSHRYVDCIPVAAGKELALQVSCNCDAFWCAVVHW
jgi:hypothetical protein